MRFRSLLYACLIAIFCFASTLSAQNAASLPTNNSAVPRLIKFSGTLVDEQGRAMKSPVGVTFALYSQQSEGAALWMETQNVETDAKGNYTVLLGANSAHGIPMELFTSGEARWLGIQGEREPEQPRVLLVSVPYALKAGDAQTLGGLPPSAFAPAHSAASNSSSASTLTLLTPAPAIGAPPQAALTGSGTTNFIPLWTPNGSTLGNSILFQSTTSNVNVNGSLSMPSTGTAVAGPTGGKNSRPFDLFASAYSSSLATAITQHFSWQAEPVGQNTSTPSGKLSLLYAPGSGVPAETGFSISSKGILTFASGQSFPGAGAVKSVGLSAPAGDFTVSGSPVTSSGTLNFAWKVVPTSAKTANAIVKRDASGNFSANTITAGLNGTAGNANALGGLAPGAFAQLAAANTFTNNQTITGTLNVSGVISGDASGLINVPATALTLPSGRRLQGSYMVSTVATGAGQYFMTNIQFPFQLASAPPATFIPVGGPPTDICPGDSINPIVTAGHICVYEHHGTDGNTRFSNFFSISTGISDASDPSGVGLLFFTLAAGNASSYGVWAVAAP